MSTLSPLFSRSMAAVLGLAAMGASGVAAAVTLTVTSAGDAPDANPGDGVCATAGAVCTLRAAIEEANALAGADTIVFNIPGLGVQVISPASALPAITSPLSIDGYTQPGSAPNSLAVGSDALLAVRLDGASAGAGVNGLRFDPGSDGSTVRGLVITRFTNQGISVNGTGAGLTGMTFAGNHIGTDASGASLTNNASGVFFWTKVSASTVGGPLPADRNVIAGNGTNGITISGAGSTGNRIENNYLSTAPDGVSAILNGSLGITVDYAQTTTIVNNVITGNFGGIRLTGAATGTVVTGNKIGVGADGVTDIADNGADPGIEIFGSAGGAPQQTRIGGIAPGEGNVFANWNGYGVTVNRYNLAHPISYGTTIRGNSFSNIASLSIDLADTAAGSALGVVNANDPNDVDDGANAFLNFPVITGASTNGAATQVSLTYQSFAVGNFEVDAYVSPACHASGHGEGRTYLGTMSIATDGSGNYSGTLSGLPATTVGQSISLTATEVVQGNTSEFSACFPIAAAAVPTPPVMGDVPNQTLTIGVPFTLNVASYVTATDGDAVLSYGVSGALPTGLVFDTGTGQVTGTPTGAGSWSVSFTATDKDGVSTADSVSFQVDPPPSGGTLQFSVASQTVSEGVGVVTVTVTRVGGTSGAVSIDYATSPMSAVAPADYATTSGTLTWPDGDATARTFTVSIVDDALAEGTEQLAVTLTDNVPTDTGSLGSPALQIITITDNDVADAVPVPLMGGWAYALLSLLLGGLVVGASRVRTSCSRWRT